MDKFKMELTWHNCKTCPPEECFNSYLLVTDGLAIHEMMWDEIFGSFWKVGLVIRGDELNKYWWADIAQTVHKTPEFKGSTNNTSKYDCLFGHKDSIDDWWGGD